MATGEPIKYLIYAVVPLGLAATFLLDVIGPFDPVISVLYIPLVALAAKVFSKAGTLYASTVCVVLTAASYILAKVEGFDRVSFTQFACISIAIAVTALLVLKLRQAPVFAQHSLLQDDSESEKSR